MTMIVERSMTDNWLSNTYLVAAGPNSDAFLVDAGGPLQPLFDKADEHGLNVTHILLTHHHHDHVAEVEQVLARHPGTPVLIHPLERDLVAGATATMQPGEAINSGALEIVPLHTPGHTAGMVSLLVPDGAPPSRTAVDAAFRVLGSLNDAHGLVRHLIAETA